MTGTWSLCIERPARPGELDPATGRPADWIGWTIGQLPAYMLSPDNWANLVPFFETLQARVCERLRCDVAELTWRAAYDLTDDDVAARIDQLRQDGVIPTDAAVVVARVP